MTKDIQSAICKNILLSNHDAVCENYTYAWEMDVALLSKSGHIHEYEVKISRSDFISDKKKIAKFEHYHRREPKTCPHYFNYVCPLGMILESEIPVWAGLYYYSENGLQQIRKAKKLHSYIIETEKVLRKMLRLNVQRKYLGGAMLTYLNKKANEKYKEILNEENTNITNNS